VVLGKRAGVGFSSFFVAPVIFTHEFFAAVRLHN
jgi:hypothetical protein